ncbi:transposase [Streptococcus dysgalactiae subsp. equisimilis]
MKNRIKNIVKQVFLTEDENKRLLALMANEKESNFSAFARKKLFNQEIESWTINFPEYEQLTERFIQIGRSINRIAKFSTQVGNISQQNFIELGQSITQLLDELEKGLSVNLKKKSTKH